MMSAMKRRLALLALAGLLAAPAEARLGQTLSQLKEKLGKPATQARKDTYLWSFESRGGQLSYAVIFNAKGESISETLRPVGFAEFSSETVQGFIGMQTELLRESKTLHAVRPGEHYRFGGREMVCSEEQGILLDEPNGVLIVWTRSATPSVAAVRPEAMK